MADGFKTYNYTFSCIGYEEPYETYKDAIDVAEKRFGAPAFRVRSDLFEFRKGCDPYTEYFYSDFE